MIQIVSTLGSAGHVPASALYPSSYHCVDAFSLKTWIEPAPKFTKRGYRGVTGMMQREGRMRGVDFGAESHVGHVEPFVLTPARMLLRLERAPKNFACSRKEAGGQEVVVGPARV